MQNLTEEKIQSNDSSTLKTFTKEVFDHFKNLWVCIAIFAVGLALLHSPTTFMAPKTTEDLGGLIPAVGIANLIIAGVLTILNSVSFFSALRHVEKAVVIGRRGHGLIGTIIAAYLAVIISIVLSAGAQNQPGMGGSKPATLRMG